MDAKCVSIGAFLMVKYVLLSKKIESYKLLYITVRGQKKSCFLLWFMNNQSDYLPSCQVFLGQSNGIERI